jgi:hypothetical protein
MATSKLVPDNWRVHLGRQIIESITESANNAYYLFIAEHVPRLNAGVPDVNDNQQEIFIDVYHNMILGKRVTNNDVKHMIRNVPYDTDTVYDMYNDADPLLAEKDFFVITNAGSFSHVWKCLDNNLGANSTVTPDFADIDANDEVYQTNDGYRWKYMYSVSETVVEKFATSQYFPIVANTTVELAATQGTIDVIEILEQGEGYDNYLTGAFAVGDIRVQGNTLMYGLTSNTTARATNGFYTGCLLYISTGAGAGQYREIVNYIVNGNGKFAIVESEFSTTPLNSDQFEVHPQVLIEGDGQTANAIARALINSSGNVVYRVEMLSRGNNYTYAEANVIANAVVGVDSAASVRPIYSPPGGHGSDPASELRSQAISFSVKVSNSESNTIPTTNQFQQFGLLRDPWFANVELELSDALPISFTVGEHVHKIDTIWLTEGCVTNSETANLTHSTGHFDVQLAADDWIYITGDDASESQLVQVNSVTNSTHITLAVNALFSDANVTMYLVTEKQDDNAVVTDRISNTVIRITNLSSRWGTGDMIVGNTSGAVGYINSISINDVDRGFDTFVGMNKYTGSMLSGTFIPNEKVYFGSNLASSSANASLHSAVSNGSTLVVYVSNQVGDFSTTIVGQNSGAVFTLATTHDPDIVFGSGRVVYLENITEVERTNSASESFNIIYKF